MRHRLGIAGVILGTLACSGSAVGSVNQVPRLLLPDLDQRPPLAAAVRRRGPPSPPPLLGFTSSVENVGYGPLLVEGRRATLHARAMRATQLVQLRGGGARRVGGGGGGCC